MTDEHTYITYACSYFHTVFILSVIHNTGMTKKNLKYYTSLQKKSLAPVFTAFIRHAV
jgi:hypothetical protein